MGQSRKMSLLRVFHIPVFFIWLIGLVGLLYQFANFSNDILNFFNFIGHQNFSGALKDLISIVMFIGGLAGHGGIERLEREM